MAETKFEDSNIAAIGGADDLAAREAKASSELQFSSAGQKAGIEIWRIEGFGVAPWPKEKYGQFYDGDSFIVLKTTVDEESGKKSWDAFFWLGSGTSIDERGTAAYKVVELDDFLGGTPVQHREVQDNETEAFLSLFNPPMRVLSGGIDGGFNHVEPESYVPRLLWVKGRGKKVRVVQCSSRSASAMNHGDVFILDAGLKVFQWNGSSSGAFERFKAADIVNAIDSDRDGVTITVLDDGDDDIAEFWDLVDGEKSGVKDASEGGSDKDVGGPIKKMFQLSDASGTVTFREVADGKLLKSSLDSNDVFIVDVGIQVFVWVGSAASKGEKREAMMYATTYLDEQGRPSSTPITRIVEGACEAGEMFDDAFE